MASRLGEKIRELRREKGMTLEQLAAATASSKSYMWELENKDVTRPSAEKLDRIAAALDVTSSFLIDVSQDAPTLSDADHVFFRKYQKADPDVKAKLQGILDVLKR